jgi:EmrB/QacA subfamily drug resistance transporter
MPSRSTNPWLVLCLVCIAQFMVILDATIVNVALPSIQTDLKLAENDLQWIVNAYTLIFGGFLLLGGRAGDLIGRKRVFLAGVVVFTVASFLNGIAESSTWLILARGLQGLGAALVAPAALSILTTTFAEGEARTKALGVWAAIATGGAAVGLLLGGILVEYLSWPWIFFVNVPVGIAAFVASVIYVPESRAAAEHRIFDLPGAVTVTAGLVALVYGIVNVQKAGWTSTSTIGFGAVALILLTAFLLIEQRQRAPLVRLGIFRIHTLRTANVSMLLVASGLFAMFFFTTLYIQRVLGFSPLQAGLAFLPVTAGIGIGAGLSQPAVKRIGIRTTSIIGMSIATMGMLLLLTSDADGTYLADVLLGLAPISVGMGLTFVPVTLLATSGLDHEDAGLASGLFNTSQQVGGALGLAILSTLAVNRTENHLGGIPGQPTAVQQGEALVTGFHAAYLGGALFFVAGIIVMITMIKRADIEQVDVDRPMTEMVA